MNVSALMNFTSTPWDSSSTSTINTYASRMNTEDVLSNKTTASTVEAQENLNPILLAFILQSSIIVVVFGNALVLIALACYRNWTSADVLLFSLSLADILDSIVALQLITIVKFFMGKHMVEPLCNVFVGLVYTFRVASATTVTVIAVERAMLLVQPFKEIRGRNLAFFCVFRHFTVYRCWPLRVSERSVFLAALRLGQSLRHLHRGTWSYSDDSGSSFVFRNQVLRENVYSKTNSNGAA